MNAPAAPDGSRGAPLDALAAEAQRLLRARPTLSIRTRLAIGMSVWFVLSVAITVVSLGLVGRVQDKLAILGAVDRYTFAIQQARRFEKNFFLYHTDLADALAGVHQAREILDHESDNMAAVIGGGAVDTMRVHVARYEQLLGRLDGTGPAGRSESRAIEAELRVHGAEMVRVAEELATRERRAVEDMLRTSQRMTLAFLFVLLLVMTALAVFFARQVLAPLQRIMLDTRRIADGDLTPIVPRRRYHDEFSELAGGINHMLRELVRRQQLLVQTHKLQAIGTLTAGVAHELNNPINNLMLTADTLQEDYPDLGEAERLELVRDIVHESERARDIVRNLLDFARRTDTEVQALDVEQLIAETLRLAGNQIRIAGTHVHGTVEENLPMVHGDRGQLVQVFLNLVINAVDAMGDGGELDIDIQKSADRDSVEIRVTDAGPGIPASQVDSVFDPFFSTKKHGKGTGLGLSVSKGIVEQHGGSIRVRSAPGRGTTFTVSLPVAKVPAGIPADDLAEIPAGH